MEPNESSYEMAALLEDDDRSPRPSSGTRTSSEFEFVEDGHPHLRERKMGRKPAEDDSLASFYKPVDSYEGRHRFDPYFQWEPQSEKKIVRKVGCCRFASRLMTR